jgi:hypothetical protein
MLFSRLHNILHGLPRTFHAAATVGQIIHYHVVPCDWKYPAYSEIAGSFVRLASRHASDNELLNGLLDETGLGLTQKWMIIADLFTRLYVLGGRIKPV